VALTFYRDGLGLESPGIVGTEFEGNDTQPAGAVAMFQLDGGLILAVYPRTELAKNAHTPLGPPSSGEFSIGHAVGSKAHVDALLAQAERAGATLTQEAHDRPWASTRGTSAIVTTTCGKSCGTHNSRHRPLARGIPEAMTDVQTLMTGLVFGEQPRWHEGRLWFSDWGTQEVIAVDLAGNSEVVLRGRSFPLCVDWLPDDRLLVVSAREGLLLRREPDGSLVTHGDLTGFSDRPPGNELVVDGRGNVYVNGGGFDLTAGEDFAPGIVALVTPDGSARQAADGIAFPNGMVVAPDAATLIVAESYAQQLTAFDIAPDGGLSNRRVWADLHGGVPDGICFDADNAVWYGGVPNQRCVRVREGGEVLQTIELGRGCFACALGGPEKKTLFMMATEWKGPTKMFEGPRTGQVLVADAPAAGAGWP
jgi:sugar lactone lactonase YvrE/uncharacterized glyoxalase superfamily protein PhnB